MEILLDNLQSTLWAIAQLLLTLALPILVKALLDWVAAKIAEMRAGLDEQKNYLIDRAVRIAVQTVEQLRKTGALPTNEQALNYAVGVVQSELDRLNILLDADAIIDAIEAQVHRSRDE